MLRRFVAAQAERPRENDFVDALLRRQDADGSRRRNRHFPGASVQAGKIGHFPNAKTRQSIKKRSRPRDAMRPFACFPP